MAKLISKTYGEALFQLAIEEGKVDTCMGEIQVLLEVLNTNDEFNIFMNHPKIKKEEKLEVVENVFANRISREVLGFFQLIIQKDRYREVGSILEYFLNQVKEWKGIGVAYITTAVELKQEQMTQIEKRILETTGFKQLEMHFATNQALIAGMVIRIGDRVVDSSIATKLKELQKDLLKIQLA